MSRAQFTEYKILSFRDFNIDLFQIRNYANDLLSCSIKCVISQPIRTCRNLKTLINPIYFNNICNIMTSGIMYYDISYYLPSVFLIASTKQSKNDQNINDNKFICGMLNFIIEEFNNCLWKGLIISICLTK